ncbi:MAG TPA: NADH:ubiquinone reductase (Na(+)-transporting) subunit B [Lentisphaeria bacterium]|nr:NADH:ubiquinone reductase (Na(+)-transporting) subunit B [Lentisphaeria bacterium]|tara:strand:- start:335 stop:1576 length:1242 start_codon:yes stop_codon:yes gene_type:complete
MKFLQNIFDKMRPDFEKGGKFEKLYPLFEAKESFTFVTRDRTKSGAHIRDALDTKRMMSTVIVALIPCMLFGIYNVGYQHFRAYGVADPALMQCVIKGAWHVMPIIIVSYAVGGIWELIFAVVRKHELNEGFLVTGLLVPLTLPPTIPLWMVAVGVSFGVVIGKEVFGGTGMNVFNPALTARAFIFFAYPAAISGDKCWRVVENTTFGAVDGTIVDGFSGATPLLVASTTDTMAVTERLTEFGQATGYADFSWVQSFVGLIPGSIGETSALCCLIGAAILLITGIGSARIMIGVLIGALCMASLLNAISIKDPTSMLAIPVKQHLVYGGFMFGLVYMATDPVSASQTAIGKWIYGFLVGFLAILIRTINPAYPEGMMLAILFMNAFAPLIDYFVIAAHMKKRMRRSKESQAYA